MNQKFKYLFVLLIVLLVIMARKNILHKYTYRESRQETETEVNFISDLQCSKLKNESAIVLTAYGPYDFGPFERPLLPNCTFVRENGNFIVLFGVTKNGIVSYLRFGPTGKAQFLVFSRLSTYSEGDYFRYGVSKIKENHFLVDTSNIENIRIDVDVLSSREIFHKKDMFLKNPIDTSRSILSGCVTCHTDNNIIDKIVAFEHQYIIEHSEVISNPEERLNEVKRKLLFVN